MATKTPRRMGRGVGENGFAVFQWRYKDVEGVQRIWRPDDNNYSIVMGGVILIAVILDQLVHLWQEKRRTRMAGKAGEQVAVGFPVGAAGETKAGEK